SRSAGDSILIILPLTSTTISFISKYLTDFPNTNLSIITDYTSCYILDLCYTEKSEKNAYIIDIADRIYVNTPEPSEAGQKSSSLLRSKQMPRAWTGVIAVQVAGVHQLAASPYRN
ncbi:hypothetical protein AAAY78_17250, partial [Alistipes onderdonkii]